MSRIFIAVLCGSLQIRPGSENGKVRFLTLIMVCRLKLCSNHLMQMVKKASFYIAQYPVLRTVQSASHFTSLTDMFTQTPSRLLWEASSHMLQLMREGCSYTYPPLSIARYSCIQLCELEQCRVKTLAQGQDSNPGSRSQESEALPLSHCSLPSGNHKL